MKFLFIVLCIFLLLRLLFKPILRLIIQSVVSKMVRNQQGGPFTRTYTNGGKKPEGTIDVDYIPPQNKKGPAPSPSTGEYVDYEEVK